jgi:hypothetical protein
MGASGFGRSRHRMSVDEKRLRQTESETTNA